MSRMLLLVDPQCDFIDGAMPVPGAADAMNSLARFLRENPERYKVKVVTCDWHPWDHCSFKEYGGEWPRHCVRYSKGAAIWPELMPALYETKGETIVLPKGQDKKVEEYSIFKNAAGSLIIPDLMETHKIDKIDVCGVAGDVCVLATLKSGAELLGEDKFNVLPEFSPSMDGGKALAEYARSMPKCEE